MTKRDKEVLEMLFGAAAAAAILEQEAKRQAEADAADTEPEATEAKTNPNLEEAQAVKELYDAFIEVGFNAGQATRFVAAILTK